jgi:predicted nucleic-acid-binding protein
LKVAVDTNVLVRFLLGDDAAQADAASAAIERYDILFIPTVVLCELVWVFRRIYRFDRDRLIAAIETLMDHAKVDMDRPAAASGLAMLKVGCDFADGCLLREAARERCETVLTFDRRFASRSDGQAKLLEPA